MASGGFFPCWCSWQSDRFLGHLYEAESEATQNPGSCFQWNLTPGNCQSQLKTRGQPAVSPASRDTPVAVHVSAGSSIPTLCHQERPRYCRCVREPSPRAKHCPQRGPWLSPQWGISPLFPVPLSINELPGSLYRASILALIRTIVIVIIIMTVMMMTMT